MTADNKTIINNWTGGGTLQTWTDGEWQILYAKDSAGNVVTFSLTTHDAVRLAYAVSPIPQEQFDRMRAANNAVYELSYPEARSDELRQIADEIECDGGCEGCSPQKQERGEFCGFVAADNLRKLASALDVKAKIDAALSPKIAAAETSPGDVGRTAPITCPNCHDESDCSNVDICNAVEAAYSSDAKPEAKSQEPDAVAPLYSRERETISSESYDIGYDDGYNAAKPEAPAVSVDAETIEAAARIIDPDAFEKWDNAQGNWRKDEARVACWPAEEKATAIAALIAGER